MTQTSDTQDIKAVILDWAGTVVDFGSFAPTQIFVDAFKQAFDFDLTLAEARGPMGLGKWQHIEALGKDPAISKRWKKQFGKPMDTADIDHIYRTFLPLQTERVADHADLIPGTLETLQYLKEHDIKIGSTTGYPRQVMRKLMAVASEKGYSPDACVCADDLKAGARPGPWMALQCVIELGVESVASCIKVDDTVPGIAEGRNAGMWTVGVALTGSPAGLSLESFQNMSEEDIQATRERVTQELMQAGADYVIDSIAELPSVIQLINANSTRKAASRK
ncbi:MAG: hypothetical protein RLZZ397_474 [Pseudomonadota bacterium]|jgi:phosphonoacetaldehyde hydrolase